MNIILALVDDPSTREAVRAALPKSDLVLFENSVETLGGALASTRVDAVLLEDDSHFGLEALKSIAEREPFVPVIVLASRAHPQYLAPFTLAGARACIMKPIQPGELRYAIEACIGDAPVEAEGPQADEPPVPQPPHSDASQQQLTALRWMGRCPATLDDPARLMQGLVDALIDAFDPTRAAVLLHAKGAARVAASDGVPAEIADSIQLSFSEGLLRRLEEHPGIFDVDGAGPQDEAAKELLALGAQFAAPLVTRGRVCGAVVMGPRTTGGVYSVEERDLFALMARCGSAALERAQQIRDTERRQQRLEAVFANVTAGVIAVAGDKTITMMNESAERILQLSAGDILGHSVHKLGSAFADVVLRAMAEHEPRMRRQIRDVAVDATLGLSVTPLEPEGAVAIFTILQADDAAKDLAYSPIWKYLSTRVAQEIKNPMVAINTFAQLLPIRHESEEFREEFAEIVQGEVKRINHVVESLYEFAGQTQLKLQRSNLNESVLQILKGFEDSLQAHSITLETDFDEAGPPVELDPALFSRAFGSVVENSIEAMPEGGTLRVATRRDNGNWRLIITDTGAGVGEEDAPRVFAPFFSTKEKGMGLGLTMASRIMHEHEGSLTLGEHTDGGSAFVFHLPVQAAGDAQ